jgi:tol-pal system protein YbgF
MSAPPRQRSAASSPGGPSPGEEQSLQTGPRLRQPAGMRAGRRRQRPGAAASAASAWAFGARLAATLFILLGVALPAQAQLFADDDARKAILDLRTRLTQSEEQARARYTELNEQMQTLRRSLLDLNSQLEAMRGEVARLRGANEQLQRDVSDVQRKQRDIAQAVDDRLRKVEPQKVTLDGQEFSADPEEKRLYDEAFALLRAGDFDKAALAFTHFVKRWPAGGYSDAARFWQGNALYGKRDYKEAIIAFRAFLAKAPEHARAPEALLAVANSQAEMKDRPGARKTLDELIKAYPKSEAAAAAKERLASLK